MTRPDGQVLEYRAVTDYTAGVWRDGPVPVDEP